MQDTSHLAALQVRLSHGKGYLSAARTAKERKLRAVWIAQIEKEIASERQFLGLPVEEALPEMSDDDLLAELAG